MKDFMICVLATLQVIGVMYIMGSDDLRARMTFRRPRQRDYGNPGAGCRIHGRDCDPTGGAALERVMEGANGTR